MLGHISWIIGDYEKAKYCYSQPKSDSTNPEALVKYRYGVDWERLIKLHFFLDEWESTIDLILKMPTEVVNLQNGKSILVDNKLTSPKSFLFMATVSMIKLDIRNDKSLVKNIRNILKVSKEEFNVHLQKAFILPDGDSGANRPLIPEQIGHRFRFKSATDSGPNRPGIPMQIGHPFAG